MAAARKVLVAALSIGLTFLASGDAEAAKRKKKKAPAPAAKPAGSAAIAVLGLLNEGGAPLSVVTAANEIILARVEAASKLKTIKGNELGAMMLLMGCSGPSGDCISLIGSSMKVAKVVYGSIERAGAGVKISLTLFDVGSGSVEGNRSGEMAVAALKKVLPKLIGKLLGISTSGTLRVSASVPGATVLLDGSAAGTTPLTLTVDAGRHSIEVAAPGYKKITASVVVGVGATAEVAAELVELPATSVKPPPIIPVPGPGGTGDVTPPPVDVIPKEKRGGNPLAIPGYVAVVAGVAAAAAGGYFGIRWLGARGDYFSALTAFPTTEINGVEYYVFDLDKSLLPSERKGTWRLCQDSSPLSDSKEMALREAIDACAKGKRFNILGWSFGIGGAVLVAAGLALVIGGGPAKAEAAAAPGFDLRHVRILPILSPEHAGALMSIEF